MNEVTFLPFDSVARIAADGDNVAIATRLLPQGTNIQNDKGILTLSNTVLLGHRFAISPIQQGQALRSWGQTFGIATKSIQRGEVICNPDVLRELRQRSLKIDLPGDANFQNELETYSFDEASFQPSEPLPRYTQEKIFMGFRRGGGRGVGTRNTIVILGTTSLASGFVRELERRFKGKADAYPNVSGISAVAHTEGSTNHANNREVLLRTLAGFIVHPNIGAILIADTGSSPFNNHLLQTYMQENNYPLADVPHEFMTLSGSFEDDLDNAESLILNWLPRVNEQERKPEPLASLKIALQCGGSDAFSGISGNPLAAWVAKEVIQYGGSANLAETDELIGAETYVLDKVRDPETATKFLRFIQRFKERVGWHGHSADGNPSGGNKYRGLYNIYLKSLGAAMKRDPEVPLDYVIEYAEQMDAPGFYFMDSPGNDIESIAGQVAAGCNMIFFVTGNGSITNFPFVPTIKIVTTTERYELLSNEMDINAGAYLDGVAMPELVAETLQYTLDVASGKPSVGETAGHSQVQIWRDWKQNRPVQLTSMHSPALDGKPLEIKFDADPAPNIAFSVYRTDDRISADQIGLIMPSSLCSGQVARICVEALNQNPQLAGTGAISQFVTLVHTEGCGSSLTTEFQDTVLGYLTHPMVRHALLLEHGCESTHNDYFRQALRQHGLNPDDYGWASIQGDGGIQNVMHKINTWFEEQLAQDLAPQMTEAGYEAISLAFIVRDTPPPHVTQAFARFTRAIVAHGGSVLLNEHDPLLNSEYARQLGIQDLSPSLNYAQPITEAGFHIMAMPTQDWSEVLTGLGAAGANVMLAYSADEHPLSGHPMIPLLQVHDQQANASDIYLPMSMREEEANRLLAHSVIETLTRQYVPLAVQSNNTHFQITRGLLGVSL